MLQLGARIVAHKLEFSHPDYHKIHLSAIAAGFREDSIIDGQGKRHPLPGLYRTFLPAYGVRESEEKLKAELSKLGFPMDIEVWSIGELRQTTIEPNTWGEYGDFFGTLLGFPSQQNPSTTPLSGLYGLAGPLELSDYYFSRK